MTKMKEQNSRSQRRRTAFCKREQNTKISFFAVRIFNLTRIEDFVKGEIANIFSMRHFWYKVANFSKIFENRFKICRTLSHSMSDDEKSKRRQRDDFDSGDIGIFVWFCKQAQALTARMRKNIFRFANKAAARSV